MRRQQDGAGIHTIGFDAVKSCVVGRAVFSEGTNRTNPTNRTNRHVGGAILPLTDRRDAGRQGDRFASAYAVATRICIRLAWGGMLLLVACNCRLRTPAPMVVIPLPPKSADGFPKSLLGNAILSNALLSFDVICPSTRAGAQKCSSAQEATRARGAGKARRLDKV